MTLHYAANAGNEDIINMLLSSTDQPANVFSQDCEGRLPIHRAILFGHARVVEALL